MWHKIIQHDPIIRNACKGDHLRFIADSGDLIADIEEIYLVLEVYEDAIEYINLKNEKIKMKKIERFETGCWYIKSQLLS